MALLERLGRFLSPRPARPYGLFQIEASLTCNLGCVMCPWSDLRGEGELMTWETFSRVAEHLHLVQSVDLTGGGETLAQPRLLDMVRTVKAAECEVGFSTNGVHLERELAAEFIAAGLDWISFSVDAARAETYERIRQGARFDQVMANITALRDVKSAQRSKTLKTMMVYVMMRENYGELPAFIDLAYELGVEQVIAKNLDVIVKEGDDDRRLFSHSDPEGGRADTGDETAAIAAAIAAAERRARGHGIPLRVYALRPQEQPICEHNPLQNLFFNWEGYVSPCITLSYADSRVFNGKRHFVPCLRFGNINQEPLGEIWARIAYRQFRASYSERVRLARQSTMDMLLGGPGTEGPIPPAPEGCRTCYYLYGV